jgi:hypothetical protein
MLEYGNDGIMGISEGFGPFLKRNRNPCLNPLFHYSKIIPYSILATFENQLIHKR